MYGTYSYGTVRYAGLDKKKRNIKAPKKRILGLNNDTNIPVGKRVLVIIGLNKDTNIVVGKRVLVIIGLNKDTNIVVGKRL